MAETYYARRSARDPNWRAAQIQGAMERERIRREEDPEGERVAHRLATRRTRERQAASGLTFHELWLRVGGDRSSLAIILRDQIRRGRIDFRFRPGR